MLPRRLDKYLKDSSLRSLSELRRAIELGQVRVSSPSTSRQPRESKCRGESETGRLRADQLIFPDDLVYLDGEQVRPRERHQTLIFHKPRSVTTTTRDPGGKQDLSVWLKKMPPGAFPVGRLDRESTGALIFTTDGDLANALLHPDHKTEKLYWLWLNESLQEDDPRLDSFLTGVEMGAGLARAQRVSILHRTEDMCELLVTLREGKNRQLRRMCRALDLRLLHLHRKSVGPISLGSLDAGEFRLLDDQESEELWKSAGGKDSVLQRQRQALLKQVRESKGTEQDRSRLAEWMGKTEQEAAAVALRHTTVAK